MRGVTIVARDVTAAELGHFARERDAQARRHGTQLPRLTRVGVVAHEGEDYVGAAVAELFSDEGARPRWGYLAELFVEAPHRKQGIGRTLLLAVEHRAALAGAQNVWTRTAGYEAPGFYLRHGYRVTHTLAGWYPSGHGNVALRKSIAGSDAALFTPVAGIELAVRLPTEAELARTADGFVEHGEAFGNPPENSERVGFVAMRGLEMTGFVSALIRRTRGRAGRWSTLTDLFVTPEQRRRGVGTALLEAMHDELRALGIDAVETWAPGFAPLAFMHEHGYETRTELEGWYRGGVSRVALTAALRR